MPPMKSFAAALLIVAAVLVVAAPASANSIPTTGTRIGLYAPPTTFPANTPFYVQHGFGCAFTEAGCPQTLMNGGLLFTLYVDGVLQSPSNVFVTSDGEGIAKWWLTNFPNGLPAGDHTLMGVWSANGVVGQTKVATITFN